MFLGYVACERLQRPLHHTNPSFRKYNSKISTLRRSSSQLLAVEISDDLQYKRPVPLSIRPKSAVKEGSCRNKYVIDSVAVNLPKTSLSALTLTTAAFKASVLSV
jgi:hypothetical protein